MEHLQKTAILPYQASQLYALVDDIERYPSFLPWCQGARVIARSEDSVTASLSLGRGSFSQSFTTKNTLVPFDKIIMSLVDGPFRQLEGVWLFREIEMRCEIDLTLDFEFENKMTAMLFGSVFQQAVNRLVDAFVARASEVYGNGDD